MKKIIFSLVALIAFTLVCLANENQDVQIKSKIVEDECVEASLIVADAIQNAFGVSLTPINEGELLLVLYEACDEKRQ